MADEIVLVAENPLPPRGYSRSTRPVTPAIGLPSLRIVTDPLLGVCLAAFGDGRRGPTAPFIARVLGPSTGTHAGLYDLLFLSTWITSAALDGAGTACGFVGAAVVAVDALLPFDVLDIRSGSIGHLARRYHLWMDALEPLTERDLRAALASSFRKRLVAPVLSGRGIALDGALDRTER